MSPSHLVTRQPGIAKRSNRMMTTAGLRARQEATLGPLQEGLHTPATEPATVIDTQVLAQGFREAVRRPELRQARALLADAMSAGVPAGILYVRVVRPALAEFDEDPLASRAQRRVLGELGESILNDMLSRGPLGRARGAGRVAILARQEQGIHALDGSVTAAFLQADGWWVESLPEQVLHSAGSRTQALRAPSLGAELVVANLGAPSDAMWINPACTDLRRLADPPVILLCDFSALSRAASWLTSLGADAVVQDPDDLVRAAASRLPPGGRRRWGVRLSRSVETLTLAPTGRLDAVSAGRLADIALSRLGSFHRLALDLTELAGIEEEGLEHLRRWPEQLPLAEVELVALASPSIRARLEGTGGLGNAWILDGPPV
jgi:hypothetical protein